MKKNVVFVVLFWMIFVVLSNGLAQNFRDLDWRYSQQQVIDTEQAFALAAELTNDETGGTDLLYTGELMDFETSLIYFFSGEGVLYRVAYGFVEARESLATYRADFDRVDSLLRAQYGEPYQTTDTWDSADGYINHTWYVSDTVMIHALLKTDTGVGHAIDLVRRFQ